MPRCPMPDCKIAVDEDGETNDRWTPLYLAVYPQPGSARGLMFTLYCKACGYDQSVERFPTRPELTYTHFRNSKQT